MPMTLSVDDIELLWESCKSGTPSLHHPRFDSKEASMAFMIGIRCAERVYEKRMERLATAAHMPEMVLAKTNDGLFDNVTCGPKILCCNRGQNKDTEPSPC